MTQLIDLHRILHIEQPGFKRCIHVLDWFSMTWLCSHVRFASLNPGEEAQVENFLAWVLKRDPSFAEIELQEWLLNCDLMQISADEISKWDPSGTI